MNKDEKIRDKNKNYEEPTARQKDIAKLFVRGVRNDTKIAEMLGIEAESVRSHVSALYKKWRIKKGSRKREEIISILHLSFDHIVKQAKADAIADFLIKSNFEDRVIAMALNKQLRIRNLGGFNKSNNFELMQGEQLIIICPGSESIPEEIRKVLFLHR